MPVPLCPPPHKGLPPLAGPHNGHERPPLGPETCQRPRLSHGDGPAPGQDQPGPHMMHEDQRRASADGPPASPPKGRPTTAAPHEDRADEPPAAATDEDDDPGWHHDQPRARDHPWPYYPPGIPCGPDPDPPQVHKPPSPPTLDDAWWLLMGGPGAWPTPSAPTHRTAEGPLLPLPPSPPSPPPGPPEPNQEVALLRQALEEERTSRILAEQRLRGEIQTLRETLERTATLRCC